jgi:hypothetical protein
MLDFLNRRGESSIFYGPKLWVFSLENLGYFREQIFENTLDTLSFLRSEKTQNSGCDS